MPTPIGHALGGLIVGLVTAGRSRRSTYRRSGGSSAFAEASADRRRVSGGWLDPPKEQSDRWTYLTISAVAACLPDLDFLWGRHNMETHSLGFAVLVGLAVFAWQRSPRLAGACVLAVASHVLFDWLGSDDTPPLGVMALWPLNSDFSFADAFVFDAISRRYWLPNFITHNLMAVAREVAILLPIAAALWWWRGARRLADGDRA